MPYTKKRKECLACKEMRLLGDFYYPPSKKRHDICKICWWNMKDQKFIAKQERLELKDQERKQELIAEAIKEANKEAILIDSGIDITKFKLGEVCKYDHKFNGLEYSLRYRNKGKCVECQKDQTKEILRKSDKHLKLVRDFHLRKTYGITLDQYNKMFKDQNGLCAICGKPETAKTRYGFDKPLSVDHDHETGKIRKLLCNKCNGGLGAFDDSIEYMENAINYIKQFQE